MNYKNNIIELIGNTPLIKLNKINKGLKPQIFAKLESSNPGGSVKDRIGIAMLEAAEKDGKISPGGTVIEATSGNTGIGLALACAVKGYKTIFVVTDKVSSEKVNYLKALGGEVIVVSNAVEPDSPEYYVNVAKRISKETPNSFFPYQYSNRANPEIHYRTTGQVIGADPLGSIFKTYKETGKIIKGTPYLVEGIGQDCLPENVHFQYIDKIINISDKDSFAASRRLTKEEGIFCGGSTGTIVHVALEISKELSENDVVVFIVCDTGERYLSKAHNIEWLRNNRMLETEIKILRDISDAKKLKGNEEIVFVHPETPVKEILKIIQDNGYSNIPVMHDRKAVGCIRENRLMSRVLKNPKLLNSTAENVWDDCFPVLDAKTDITEVREYLKNNPAILVSDFGRITDIITRYDLLEYSN